MADTPSTAARALLLSQYQGALATQSQAMPGFPFGSVAPYCLDAEGRPLLLISRIAQHTRNLKADPKCSLLLAEPGADDAQAAARLTVMAHAEQLQGQAQIDAAAERYYRYFPEAAGYDRAHDFDFWVLAPVRYRYIGGFGAIDWLDQVTLANPFAGEVERGMVDHMNADHAKAIAHYVQLAGLPAHTPAVMAGVDSEGFHLRVGQRLHWLPFSAPCNTPKQVREALVALAHTDAWPPRSQS